MAIVRRELKVKARGHGQWFGTAKIARWSVCFLVLNFAFSALTLLVGRQEGHPVCKNCVVGAGVVYKSVPGETLLHALKRQQTAPRSGHATF